MFRPGGLAEERRPGGKVMEVTGEIVSSEHVALPKIQLEAFTPEPEPVPPSWPDVAAAPSGTEAPRAAKKDRVSALDATTELPIFREVESAWFKAVTPAPKKVEDDAPRASVRPPRNRRSWRRAPNRPTGPRTPSVADTTGPSTLARWRRHPRRATLTSQKRPSPPPRRMGGGARYPSAAHGRLDAHAEHARRRAHASAPAGQGTAEHRLERAASPPPKAESGSYAWRTAADDGWSRVDNAFAETVSAETTSAGLPMRRPMERLVPGAVEESQETVSAQKRNPEGIRGLLSAYHRGVQRGRGNDGN